MQTDPGRLADLQLGRANLFPILAVGGLTALLLGGYMLGAFGAFKKEYMERFKDKRLMVQCHYDGGKFVVYGVAIEVNEVALVLKDDGNTCHIPFGLIKYITEYPAGSSLPHKAEAK